MKRFFGRVLLGIVVLVALLLAPVGYTELACRGTASGAAQYQALLPPDQHRPEARTLMTYPEWHIVHAYDDYAQVITTGDPHEFGFVRAIAGFWTSLCDLSRAAADHGGVDGPTRQMVYTIGVSFTAELLAKAAYEETLGRIFTLLRGPDLAQADHLSAEQAAAYARFLQQVPWYQWDFAADRAALSALAPQGLRDRERQFALRAEARVKAGYARLIARAVQSVGADALRLQMIVTGVEAARVADWPDVTLVAATDGGLRIETPRYRALTGLMVQMAAQGARFEEIAGNDDILLTVLGAAPYPGALTSFDRQGYGDTRSLLLIKVTDLAGVLRDPDLTIEHVHDY